MPRKTAVLVALPVLLLGDTALALARGWDPKGVLDVVIVACIGLALATVLWMAATRRGLTFYRERGEALVFVGLSAAGAWLVAEVIVGLFVWIFLGSRFELPPAELHRRPPDQAWTFYPDAEYLPGVEGASRYTTNSLGIRGPELGPREGTYRILCVGGSTTECTYLDDEETWTHLLMERLNAADGPTEVWAGGAGISGFPSSNHLRFVQESPVLAEVDCVVLLVGANDFNQYLRGRLVDGRLLPRQTEETGPKPLWGRSQILWMVRKLWHARMGAFTAEDLTGRNHALRRTRRQNGRLRDTLPDLDIALQEYAACLEAIVVAVREQGARPVLITQPTLWDVELDGRARGLLWLGDITEDEYLSIAAARTGLDRYNEVVTRVGERLDVECIRTESMNGRVELFYDDYHYNEAGARELARIVAEHFLERAGAEGWQ